MSAKFEMLVKSLTETMKNPKKTTSPYDTTATVVRIDGDTAYVHIAGGVDETPVSKTVNCKEGDTVQVRVGGGRAWITGNATAPPTDDTRAIKASGEATKFITDTSNGVFVHREGDEKNGVKITDQVDIVRDGNVSASYGEETVFYQPRTTKIAAKIGAFGLRIVRGIISLGNKTSANDVTNAGTYIDSNGNMATSNIKAHGGTIGGFSIGRTSLSRSISYDGVNWNTLALDQWGIDFNNKSALISYSNGGLSIDAPSISFETSWNGFVDIDYKSLMMTNEPYGATNGVASSSGQLYFFANGDNSTNHRGVYTIDATGENAKYIITIDGSNNAHFYGAADSVSDLKKKSVINDYDWKIDEFIRGLKPIAFYQKHTDGTTGDRIHYGFGAQQVKALVNDLGMDELGAYNARRIRIDEKGCKHEDVDYHGEKVDDSELAWGLVYAEFVAPMVLEMQRLMDRVDKLEDENSQLLHRLEKLEQEVNSMKEGAVK